MNPFNKWLLNRDANIYPNIEQKSKTTPTHDYKIILVASHIVVIDEIHEC